MRGSYPVVLANELEDGDSVVLGESVLGRVLLHRVVRYTPERNVSAQQGNETPAHAAAPSAPQVTRSYYYIIDVLSSDHIMENDFMFIFHLHDG